MSKLETISYQGKDYATVPVRLKEFREIYPKASISTMPMYQEDGSLIFKAEIVQDRTDETSAVSTGHARYTAAEIQKVKAFEKLETISIGRALSVMGFLNNGEVASTEELEEFNAFKNNKVNKTVKAINECTKLEELKSLYMSLGSLSGNPEVYAAKEAKKKELSNVNN